jgi:hypothetical protein
VLGVHVARGLVLAWFETIYLLNDEEEDYLMSRQQFTQRILGWYTDWWAKQGQKGSHKDETGQQLWIWLLLV